MMKNFLFILLVCTNIAILSKNESFEPEVSQNIQQTVYWGVIVETLKTPIKDFLTHQNTHLLTPELKKVMPQVFVSPKELVSIITLLLLQPDLRKKLQIYGSQEQREILKKLFAALATTVKDSQNLEPIIPGAINHIIEHAS